MMSINIETVDKDYHRALGIKTDSQEGQIIEIARLDPDVFINYAGAFNAIKEGPNKWYPPRVGDFLYTFPYGSHSGLSLKTVWMTCPMHREWQEKISNNPWVYIEAPREHAKTQRVGIFRIIWDLGENPNQRIKVVYQNDEKAAETVAAIAQNILLNERVKKVFPNLEPDDFGTWSGHKITVKRSFIGRDASVEASGVLATGVSGRADILYFDDPVDYKNAIQFPSMRDTIKNTYKDVWLNLLPSRFGRLCYICTPWHIDDNSSDIKKNHSRDYVFSSNPINEKLDPVWEAKWDRKALEERRRKIGERAFDRGFRLKPLSDEDQLFRPTMFAKCYDFKLKFGDLPEDFRRGCHFYSGVDPGSSGKSENPQTSVFTFAEKRGLCIPVEIKASHFGELEKMRQINSTSSKWKPEVVAVENNSYQETLVRLMKEMRMKIPIRGIYTGSDKIDLDTGLPSLELEIENRMWLIPTAGHVLEDDGSLKSDGCPLCKWLEECFQYPIGFSDILMSWWIAREGFRSLKGFSSKSMLRVLSFPTHSKPSIDKFFKTALEEDDDED